MLLKLSFQVCLTILFNCDSKDAAHFIKLYWLINRNYCFYLYNKNRDIIFSKINNEKEVMIILRVLILILHIISAHESTLSFLIMITMAKNKIKHQIIQYKLKNFEYRYLDIKNRLN
jgi:hypothetical protein